MSKILILILGLAPVIACMSPAGAEQGPTFGGPVGATDVGNAYLPQKPGVYVGLVDAFAWADRSANGSGNSESGAGTANVEAFGAAYVYPFKLFSGNVASSIQGAYEDPYFVTVPHAGRAVINATGWKDLYVDFIDWSRYIGPLFGEAVPRTSPTGFVPYGLTVKASYAMIFPVGKFLKNESVDSGTGTLFYIPNFAATYLTPPNKLGGGIEFNAHFFLDARATNPYNDYSNGTVVDVDYAIAQRMHRWTVGFAGAYAVQVNYDRQGPPGHQVVVAPDGDRAQLLTFGPIVTYQIPRIHALFKIKAPFALEAHNTFPLNDVILGLTFPIP